MEEIKNFLGGNYPFDILTPSELDTLVAATDIAYFAKSDTIPPTKFYVILKGIVWELEKDEPIEAYKDGDSFDIKWILDKPHNDYVAHEETIAYAIDAEIFRAILKKNRAFKNSFLLGVSHKLQDLQERRNLAQLGEMLSAKVGDIILQAPTIVDAKISIKEAAKQMPHLLVVKKEELLGVATPSDLKKFFINDLSPHDPIAQIASFPALEIDKEEFLFNALLLMTKEGIKHLLVKDNDTVIGTLDITEILSYLSNQSYFLTKKIEKAASLDELAELMKQFDQMIQILFQKGIKSRYLAKLVSEINKKLYAKVATLTITVPSMLLLLGSEGRGEQLLRNDQDNALIVHDPNDLQKAQEEAKNFTEALLKLGFPKCPGNVMVSNPKWCQSQEGYKKMVLEWIEEPSAQNLMDLAIFFDASPVAKSQELEKIKSFIFEHISNNISILANMAKAVLQFETPSFFQFLKKEPIDLKKSGIFPIVHGARVLAMQNSIEKTSTVERIKEISDLGIISHAMATDLIESFDALHNLRLKASLEKGAPTNIIEPHQLGKLERDLLKDSFKVVDTFKDLLKYHFRLDMVS